MTKISKAKGKGKEATKGPEYDVNLGTDLDSAVEMFGKEVVYANFQRNAVIGARSVIGALEKAGKDPKEIQKEMDSWKPGSTRRVPKSSRADMLAEYANMDEEAQKTFMKDLLARAAG